MPLVGQQTYSLWAHGKAFGTYTVTFPPIFTIAQISLNHTTGGGTHLVGIAAYKFRPERNGPEQVVDITEYWTSWPATVVADNMSSVTFGIVTGPASYHMANGVANLFWWA